MDSMTVEVLARALHDWRKTQSLAGCGWAFTSVVDGEVLCPCPADAAAILAAVDDPFASEEWRQMEQTAAGYRRSFLDATEEHVTSDEQLRETLTPGPCPACGRLVGDVTGHVRIAHPEYHEHVAGDKHAHAYNGPHSHGGVSALVSGDSVDEEPSSLSRSRGSRLT